MSTSVHFFYSYTPMGFWDRSEVFISLLEVILRIIKSLFNRQNKTTSKSIIIQVGKIDVNVTYQNK